MKWRLAKSLDVLRNQVNEMFPNRTKDWDGSIASAQHHNANPTSDHEAVDIGDGNGPVVKAIDLTHDPECGFDSYKFADYLLKLEDQRIKYIISNGRISSGTDQDFPAWTWRKYKGSNKHDHHVHISIKRAKRFYDNDSAWDIDRFKPKFVEVESVVDSPLDTRLRMGKFILDYEARRDQYRRLRVYPLPSGDGGGIYEVAGINDRYHPNKAKELAELIRKGKYNEAEQSAIEYMATYTDIAGAWHPSEQVQFYLRDCAFNRGPSGAARIYQKALAVKIDGSVGPVTLKAGATLPAKALLPKLRDAREWYERAYAKRDETSKFWKGLVKRWNRALDDAKTFKE